MSLQLRTSPEPIEEENDIERKGHQQAQSSPEALPGAVFVDDCDGNSKPVPPAKPGEDATGKDGQDSVEQVSEPDAGAVRVFAVSLPVRVGGALLAFCAGVVNAVAFHALSAFVSHQTGTLSKIALGLEDSETADPTFSLSLLVSFVVGSTVCGCFIGHNTVHFGLALYDFGLISVCSLLLAATFVSDKKVASCFAAAACGLQNGLATSWGGAVIRTTHVTGLLTDAGLLIGRILSIFVRRRCGSTLDAFDKVDVADDLSKLSVLLSIGIAFFIGVFIGACLHNSMKRHAFLIPAGIEGTVGFIYAIYRVFILHQSVFTAAEMEIVDMPEQGIQEVCINSRNNSRNPSKASVTEGTSSSATDGDERDRSVFPACSAELQLDSVVSGRRASGSKSFTPDHSVVAVERAALLAGGLPRSMSKEPSVRIASPPWTAPPDLVNSMGS